MNKYESKEDYLERILMLSENNKRVRAIDIANDMNYTTPSVSIALKKLKKEGRIVVDEHGNISLTETGKKIALEVYEKHKIISSLLIMMGVSEKTAKEDACKIEHDLSEESFTKIKAYLQKEK